MCCVGSANSMNQCVECGKSCEVSELFSCHQMAASLGLPRFRCGKQLCRPCYLEAHISNTIKRMEEENHDNRNCHAVSKCTTCGIVLLRRHMMACSVCYRPLCTQKKSSKIMSKAELVEKQGMRCYIFGDWGGKFRVCLECDSNRRKPPQCIEKFLG